MQDKIARSGAGGAVVPVVVMEQIKASLSHVCVCIAPILTRSQEEYAASVKADLQTSEAKYAQLSAEVFWNASV